jgi:tetratricopeptide (TPR) repeat protein
MDTEIEYQGRVPTLVSHQTVVLNVTALLVLCLSAFGCCTSSSYVKAYKEGNAAYSKRDYQAARSLYEKAMAEEPRFAPPYLGVGLVYENGMNDKNTAAEYYNLCATTYEKNQDLLGKDCADQKINLAYRSDSGLCYHHLAEYAVFTESDWESAAVLFMRAGEVRWPYSAKADSYLQAEVAYGRVLKRPVEQDNARRRRLAYEELSQLYEAGNYDHLAYAKIYEKYGLMPEAQEELAQEQAQRMATAQAVTDALAAIAASGSRAAPAGGASERGPSGQPPLTVQPRPNVAPQVSGCPSSMPQTVISRVRTPELVQAAGQGLYEEVVQQAGGAARGLEALRQQVAENRSKVETYRAAINNYRAQGATDYAEQATKMLVAAEDGVIVNEAWALIFRCHMGLISSADFNRQLQNMLSGEDARRAASGYGR